MTTTLPGILQAVAPVLNHYGYAAVSGFLLLENLGLPLPGETILIAASLYAGTGRLNIVAVWITATLACIIGDNIGFAIGHYGGERFVAKYGRYILLTTRRLTAAQDFFNRYGGPIVLVARFIAGLRQLNGIVAGSADMTWPKFILYNSVGAIAWVSVWSALGYFAGNHLVAFYRQIHQFELVAIGLVAAAIVALAIRYRYYKS